MTTVVSIKLIDVRDPQNIDQVSVRWDNYMLINKLPKLNA